jgi:hypothetical protein
LRELGKSSVGVALEKNPIDGFTSGYLMKFENNDAGAVAVLENNPRVGLASD